MEQDRRNFLKLCGAVSAGISLAKFTGVVEAGAADYTLADLVNGAAIDWGRIRKEFFSLPDFLGQGDYIYMNNSTLGPTLNPVLDRMNAVQQICSQGCDLDQFLFGILLKLKPMRAKMGELINAPAPNGDYGHNIGNVDSVTEGMSLVANGITFRKGDVILITDHEHSGGRTMWELQAARYGARVIEIPLLAGLESEKEWADGLVSRFRRDLQTYNVRVISFPWITTSTGHVLPAERLCALAAEYGAISVIDGAQAFAILPVDVKRIDCDFLVVNGHKYLCGPVGSGFIYINDRMLQSFESFYPTVVDSEAYYHPEDLSLHFPHRKGGISAYTNILPLDDALQFHMDLGPRNVYKRLLQIGRWLRKGLSAYPNHFELLTPIKSDLSCVMTCFRMKQVDSETVYQTLKNNYNIHVKHSTEGGADSVRIAPHYYNTAEELKYLAYALCQIAGVKGNGWPAPDFSG